MSTREERDEARRKAAVERMLEPFSAYYPPENFPDTAHRQAAALEYIAGQMHYIRISLEQIAASRPKA